MFITLTIAPGLTVIGVVYLKFWIMIIAADSVVPDPIDIDDDPVPIDIDDDVEEDESIDDELMPLIELPPAGVAFLSEPLDELQAVTSTSETTPVATHKPTRRTATGMPNIGRPAVVG